MLPESLRILEAQPAIPSFVRLGVSVVACGGSGIDSVTLFTMAVTPRR
jgi:hypothetical protein